MIEGPRANTDSAGGRAPGVVEPAAIPDSADRPAASVPPAADSPALGNLFRSLSADAATLVRQEIALARAELRSSLRQAGRNSSRIVAGGVVAGVGGLVVIAGVVVLVGDLLGGAYWVSALVVGAVLLLAGGGLCYSGIRSLRNESLAPEATIDSLRRTGGWVRDEVEDFRSTLAAPTDGNGVSIGHASPPPSHPTDTTIRVVPRDHRSAAHDSGDGAGERQDDRGGGGKRKNKHRDENLAVAVGKEMMEDDALNVAGGMAYFAFLALPPTIVMIFALTGFFGGDAAAEWITAQLSAAMPDEASDLIDGFVRSVVYTQAPGLFSLGLVLALWASSNIFMAVARALNIAYDIEENRSFIKMRALALGVTLLFVVFMLSGSALLLLGPGIANALDLFGVANLAWNIAQWVLPFLLVVGAFMLAYYILPNRQQKRHNREILIGAVVGAVVWVIATVAFRFYISNFGGYDETYGTLGGIIILLLWLYMTMLVILLGGQVAAELERRARK
jgi:membrane protein